MLEYFNFFFNFEILKSKYKGQRFTCIETCLLNSQNTCQIDGTEKKWRVFVVKILTVV